MHARRRYDACWPEPAQPPAWCLLPVRGVKRPWGGVLSGLVLGNSAVAYLINLLVHGPIPLWRYSEFADAIQGGANFAVLPLPLHLFYRSMSVFMNCR